MDDETGIEITDAGAIEVERRLRAYADARLAPDARAMARIRRVLTARSEATHVAAPFVPIAGSHRIRRAELVPVEELHPARRRGPWRRRAVALALAATLAIGGAAAVSAAPPDSPLYETRLLVEGLTLPAESSDRAKARVAAIQQRITEADSAAKDGNGKALSAALAAYRKAVREALREAGDDPDQLARLQAALGLHVEALSTIDEQGIANDNASVGDALEESRKAVEDIKTKQHGKPADSPGRGPGG